VPVSVNPGLPWRLLQTWITTFCLHAAALFSRPSWSEIVTTNSQIGHSASRCELMRDYPEGKRWHRRPHQ
jgi:hypothetical protein